MARPSKPLLWAGATAVGLVAVWAWQHFGLGALLTLDNLKASRDALQAQVGRHEPAPRVGAGRDAAWDDPCRITDARTCRRSA